MNTSTLLHRQVHPSWVQQGRVTSQAFRPTPKDEKRLSVYDGDQIAAEAAWTHYTNTLGYASVGVLSVTVGECERPGLTVVADPEPFPEHVLINFDEFAENHIRQIAKDLRMAAASRGWQYRVEMLP